MATHHITFELILNSIIVGMLKTDNLLSGYLFIG